jgi:hypothetical protein
LDVEKSRVHCCKRGMRIEGKQKRIRILSMMPKEKDKEADKRSIFNCGIHPGCLEEGLGHEIVNCESCRALWSGREKWQFSTTQALDHI